MPMEIENWAGLAGAPLVQALVEATKRTFPQLPARWYVAVSVAWGVLLNLALAYLLSTDLRVGAVVGVVTGLLTAGIFAASKTGENSLTPHG